jgi:hypothetical protein
MSQICHNNATIPALRIASVQEELKCDLEVLWWKPSHVMKKDSLKGSSVKRE